MLRAQQSDRLVFPREEAGRNRNSTLREQAGCWVNLPRPPDPTKPQREGCSLELAPGIPLPYLLRLCQEAI